jgi:hypothetical protein
MVARPLTNQELGCQIAAQMSISQQPPSRATFKRMILARLRINFFVS